MNNVQLIACQIVEQVLNQGRNLNQVLETALRQQKDWASAQRAALQDLSYGTLRYYAELDAMLALLLNKPLSQKDIHYLLLVALYQLCYSKAAPHAIVDHAVRATQKMNARLKGVVNGVLRNFLRRKGELQTQVRQQATARFNHPDWWINELVSCYPDNAEAILACNNQHPPMTLRVNQRKISTSDYLNLLQQQNIVARIVPPDAILLEQAMSVQQLPFFAEGYVSVQDAGAQFAARLLDVVTGQRVLDACAAPGGKTAHILELADVDLLALDKSEARLKRVAENLARIGADARLKAGDAAEPADWWDGLLFDRILADVPCSASGVVRRHPDIKWLRRPSDIDRFAAQQQQILRTLWALLKPNGKLLYATCSVFDKENKQLVDGFVAENRDCNQLALPSFVPQNGQLLPCDVHDGFYYALLQKLA